MHIVFLDNNAATIWKFRRDLILTLIHNGYDVTVLVPEGPFIERVQALGCRIHLVPLNRFLNPVRDIRFFFSCFSFFRRLKPDIVYTMTIKPNIFGTQAAYWAGVPKIFSLVPGIGSTFSKGKVGLKRRLLGTLVRFLYRIGCSCTQKVLFLNDDDHDTFLKKKIVSASKSMVINGEGINLKDYNPQENECLNRKKRIAIGIPEKTPVVLMISRVNISKGTYVFLDAAKELKKRHRDVKLVLVGALDIGSIESVSPECLTEKQTFKWLGFRDDIRELIAMSNIVALPSFYQEGHPRSLMEAMAMKKPVITTDNVGCRECIEPDRTGIMIPIQDHLALVQAIETLLDNPELQKRYGEAGFEKARREFSMELINRKILEVFFEFQDTHIPEIHVEDTGNQVNISVDQVAFMKNVSTICET